MPRPMINTLASKVDPISMLHFATKCFYICNKLLEVQI
jgi:hypothetical protein